MCFFFPQIPMTMTSWHLVCWCVHPAGYLPAQRREDFVSLPEEFKTMQNGPTSYKRLWIAFAFVMIASFAVLGGYGFRIASIWLPLHKT
jgi:nitrate reductase NapE component